MVDTPSGDQDEQDANVDLKGVIKDLHDEIKALNKLLVTFGGQIQGVNKGFHKTKQDQLDIIKAQGDMVKSNLEFRKSLQNSENSLQLFTGMLTKGIAPAMAFNKIVGKIGGVSIELENMREAQEEYSKFMSENMTKDLSSDVNRPLLEEKMEKQAAMKESQEKYDKTKGGKGQQKITEGIASMKTFAEKHKTGMLIGAGSAAVLIGILKKALSASPMFQQMMKLLNFGIMMVLRPIGDFFGFLFRPILIMLLRKFIIPWYTKMYPQMMKWGTEIGTKLAGAFTALANGDVAGAFAALWGKVDWGAAVWDTIKAVVPVFAVSDFIAGIFGIGNNKWFNEWGRAVGDWFRGGLDEAKTNWSMMWYNVYYWFAEGITKIGGSWSKFFTSIYEWFKTGITTATVTWTNFWTMIKDAIWNSVFGGNDNNNTDKKNTNTDRPWWETATSSVAGWIGLANGGHINEPIAGIGRSGQKYRFGERGGETVIPDGAGMGITINIENMSASQQDLNNLRQTILDVIQESNSRRGRA